MNLDGLVCIGDAGTLCFYTISKRQPWKPAASRAVLVHKLLHLLLFAFSQQERRVVPSNRCTGPFVVGIRHLQIGGWWKGDTQGKPLAGGGSTKDKATELKKDAKRKPRVLGLPSKKAMLLNTPRSLVWPGRDSADPYPSACGP